MTFKFSLTCNIYLIQSYSSKKQIKGNKSVLNENIELCNENISILLDVICILISHLIYNKTAKVHQLDASSIMYENIFVHHKIKLHIFHLNAFSDIYHSRVIYSTQNFDLYSKR